MKFRCIIHGSFRKHFGLIHETAAIFEAAGIEVVAPDMKHELAQEKDGFWLMEGQEAQDPRLVELLYLHNLKYLGEDGFSYFVNPDGYFGTSTSYELGIAQLTNVRCFFMARAQDHPAYVHANAIWAPEKLAQHVTEHDSLPSPRIKRNEQVIHKLWHDLMVPGSVVAAGAVIEYEPTRGKRKSSEQEILLVKTHKWGNRYSMVGGKVLRNERLSQTLLREVREETKLSGEVGRHLVTFDQIKNSGYYQKGTQHIFVDNVVKVRSKKVILNEEAQDYAWVTIKEALKLPIEPNALHTIKIYAGQI